VPAGLWLAFAHPVVFLVLLGVLAVLTILLIHWIGRGLVRLYSRRSA
jgi:hypothetical protein